MKSVAKYLSTASLLAAMLSAVVGSQTTLASSAAASSSSPIVRVQDVQHHWTFYATFATAGACFAAAASYKNEYWWVEATTCVHNAAHNTWLMFYES